jgi:hypothetical protein
MIEMGPKLSFKLGGATVTATGSKASGFRGFLPTPAAQPTHALRARSLGSFHDEDHVDICFSRRLLSIHLGLCSKTLSQKQGALNKPQ